MAGTAGVEFWKPRKTPIEFDILFLEKKVRKKMKVNLTVYYEDNSSEIIEIEKPRGAHPDSIGTIAKGVLVAEKTGKRVSKIGRSKMNPFSIPAGKPVIDDNLLSRKEVLENLRVSVNPMPDKYTSLYN